MYILKTGNSKKNNSERFQRTYISKLLQGNTKEHSYHLLKKQKKKRIWCYLLLTKRNKIPHLPKLKNSMNYFKKQSQKNSQNIKSYKIARQR